MNTTNEKDPVVVEAPDSPLPSGLTGMVDGASDLPLPPAFLCSELPSVRETVLVGVQELLHSIQRNRSKIREDLTEGERSQIWELHERLRLTRNELERVGAKDF